MAITAAMVKELREKTGAGMMDCKKALTATDGDAAKAVDWLREKGIAKAEKKAGRVAAEGAVGAFVAADGKTGCVVEINCETDFAAGNDQFKELLAKVAEHIVATKPADMDALNDSVPKLRLPSAKRFPCVVSLATKPKAVSPATSTWAAKSAFSLT